jgi:hypothetical protein
VEEGSGPRKPRLDPDFQVDEAIKPRAFRLPKDWSNRGK